MKCHLPIFGIIFWALESFSESSCLCLFTLKCITIFPPALQSLGSCIKVFVPIWIAIFLYRLRNMDLVPSFRPPSSFFVSLFLPPSFPPSFFPLSFLSNSSFHWKVVFSPMYPFDIFFKKTWMVVAGVFEFIYNLRIWRAKVRGQKVKANFSMWHSCFKNAPKL